MESDKIWSDAHNLYEVRHFAEALPVVRKYAKKGNPEALRTLGKMAYFGQGMKKDPGLAYDCFYKAAIELDLEAVYFVGRCLEDGTGVPADPAKAFEYYTAASVRGSVDAQLREALCHEEGIGVPPNPQKALSLYVDLAKRVNHPYATFRIGMAYLEGQGVAKSPENAFSWLNRALTLGSVDAMNQFRLIGTKSKKDDRTASDLLAIGEDLFRGDRPKEAIPYLMIAANEGETKGLLLLEEAYRFGRGVPLAKDTAFSYAVKAAERKDPEGMFRLGQKYENGDGVPSSFPAAARWYAEAARLGHPAARIELQGIRGY